VLREKYFRADVGITGGNFLIAETGSSMIVTNEGNGDLTQTLAKVHIVTTGIERVVPTLDDATLFLRLLARSATGQETETYTTISTGPRRATDLDGPEEYHVVLVDNGRSKMLAGHFRDMLRCIRCGACMNHCPVYGSVGGHAYGWVYPGPMGSVLTPLIKGLDNAYDLPNACTLNGRCASVCPVKIPLPDLLRELRHMQHQQELSPVMQRRALKAWRFVATRPKLYHAGEWIAVRVLKLLGRKGSIRRLPFAQAWTDVRDLPTPGRADLPATLASTEGQMMQTTQNSRDAIFGAIRSALKRAARCPTPAAPSSMQTCRSTPARRRTKTCSNASSASSRAVPAPFSASVAAADIPAAVEAYRASMNLPHRAAVGAAFKDLSWPADWQVHHNRAGTEERCRSAPASPDRRNRQPDAGASADSPTTHNFVPDDHVVVLEAASIVGYFEEAWAILRQRSEGMPRATNIISGPSRTADVEQTIQLGAHGPRRVHVLIVGA
jgi:L-lactate utilization protein LutB